MARGRFLNISIATDIKLNSLSLEAHWLYMMTIPHLDRDGLIVADRYVLFGKVCPRRPELIGHIDKLIAEWCSAGLVIVYPTPDGLIAYFCGFQKNQVGMTYSRETPSIFAPPPGMIPSASGLVHVVSMQDTCNLHADYIQDTDNGLPSRAHAGASAEVELEVKDQLEVKGEVAPTAATPTPQQEMFAAVCEAIGWDYKTLSKEDKGQVAQACGILGKANYTVDDIRRFMVDVWFKDWRWEKHGEHPSLKVLRQEIGKIRSMIPSVAPPVNQNGYETFKALARKDGVEL
jgi:hypothetical protein